MFELNTFSKSENYLTNQMEKLVDSTVRFKWWILLRSRELLLRKDEVTQEGTHDRHSDLNFGQDEGKGRKSIDWTFYQILILSNYALYDEIFKLNTTVNH